MNAIQLSNGWMYISDSNSWKYTGKRYVGYEMEEVSEDVKTRVYANFLLAQKRYYSSVIIPLSFILVTNRCNLSCVYCYANANTDSEIRHVSVDDVMKLVTLIGNPDRVNRVSFSGGEPLLYWDEVVQPCLDRVFGYGFCKIYTNGVLLDEKKARKLLDTGTKLFVAVDVPGDEGGHGGEVVDILEFLSKRIPGFSDLVEMSVCLRAGSFGRIDSFIETLRKRVCYSRVEYNVTGGEGLDLDSYREVVLKEMESIKEGRRRLDDSFLYRYVQWIVWVNNCRYGKFKLESCDFSMSLNYRGDIMLCHEYGSFYDLNDRYEEMRVCSVGEVNSALQLDELVRRKGMELRMGFRKEECMRCALKYWCGGQCWANIQYNSYLCELARVAFPYVLDFVVVNGDMRLWQ